MDFIFTAGLFFYRQLTFRTFSKRGFFLVFLIVSCPVFGQGYQKKAVTEADYHLWGTLVDAKLSDSGKWIRYSMLYDENPDTLFVKRTDGKQLIRIANGHSGAFSKENVFACLDDRNMLHLINLKSGKLKLISEVKAYHFAFNGKYIVTQGGNSGQELEIRTNEGTVIKNIAEVTDYKLNAAANLLLYCQVKRGQVAAGIVDLSKGLVETTVFEQQSVEIGNLVWQHDGRGLAFLTKAAAEEGSRIYYYSVADKTLKHLDSRSAGFPEHFHVQNGYVSNLSISDGGDKVLFTIAKDAGFVRTLSGVQQWNGTDPVVYPERMRSSDLEFNQRIAVWWPATEQVKFVTSDDTPLGFLNASQDYALVYNKNEVEPQYKLTPNVNLHVVNLETGTSHKLLDGIGGSTHSQSLSPKGKYFAFFKQGHWWIYDFKTEIMKNLTGDSGLDVVNAEDPGWKSNYFVVGWGPNDEYLLINDKYDLWKFSVEGGKPVRLTRGREAGISYSISNLEPNRLDQVSFRGHVDAVVDLNKRIVLYTSMDNNDTGFSILDPKGKVDRLFFGPSYNTDIVKAEKADVYAFVSQRFDRPPALCVSGGKKSRVVYQSNPQHYHYQWGKQQVIEYRNSKGVLLKGLLHYPSNYEPGKKYPMIVYIYESQYHYQHRYRSPSLYEADVFKLANFTSQGYFVLLPSIVYEVGNPGKSAVDCVVAATKQVVAMGDVLESRIGLIGTSFGGYETNFIVTQTDLFRTAVSSASVFDLPGYYLTLASGTNKPEIWRFEDHQWRMASLFADRKIYVENSPSTFAGDIKTPMLLWTGDKDYSINHTQSIALYLALRRQEKDVILLTYPGEGHSLFKRDNQKDLSGRLKDWFGYYLKEERPAEWIAQGVK